MAEVVVAGAVVAEDIGTVVVVAAAGSDCSMIHLLGGKVS